MNKFIYNECIHFNEYIHLDHANEYVHLYNLVPPRATAAASAFASGCGGGVGPLV